MNVDVDPNPDIVALIAALRCKVADQAATDTAVRRIIGIDDTDDLLAHLAAAKDREHRGDNLERWADRAATFLESVEDLLNGMSAETDDERDHIKHLQLAIRALRESVPSRD